jgi:hypothetical protein
MNLHKQKGLSLIGFILVLALALFVSFLGMKIGPIYLEYYSVVNAMNGLAAEKGSAKLSPYQIRLKFITRLNVSYAENVKEKHIRLTRGNGVLLRVAYEVREPIIGNLDVVAKFDNSVRLSN